MAGSNVQLSVMAGGISTPTYQWLFNGSPFNGAELGSVTSVKATLISSAAPVSPPTTPAPASGGGGLIEGWFVLACIMLGAVRCFVARAIRS